MIDIQYSKYLYTDSVGANSYTVSRYTKGASRGVAVCELSFASGEPDYTLCVDGKAIGTAEAKPAGHSLVGVEEQSTKYVTGLPPHLPAWRNPLRFSYESTGEENRFTNRQSYARRD